MSRPWEPEEVVDAARARRLLAARFPDLADAAVEPLGRGWDNSAFLVDGAWVFRFPRRALAVDLMRAECAVLPAIAPRLPLRVPVPERVALEPTGDYPWPFAGYRALEGEVAATAPLDEGTRASAAPALGAFLAALHAIPAAELAALGAPTDVVRRCDLPLRLERFGQVRGLLARLGVPVDDAALDAVAADLPDGWTPEERCACHGDLDDRHVLVDPAGAPVGVIDWGDVHRGDPAVDLALAWSAIPRHAHAGFRAAYGPIDGGRWRVARFRALLTALNVLAYAADEGLADLRAASERSLARISG